MLSNRSKKLLSTLQLSLCSVPAFASNALNGFQYLPILFFTGIAAICTVIAFILAMINANRNGRGMRIASIIFSLPLLFLVFYSLTVSIVITLISLVILLLLWVLIYTTWASADTSPDTDA